MTADFTHLAGLEVSDDSTAKYILHQITVNSVSPTLVLAPATQTNKPYFNALLKRANRNASQVRARAVNPSLIDENRMDDRELYAKFVLKDWLDVLDADGSAVEFTPGNVADFLAALPDWLFDNIRDFSSNSETFSELVDVDTTSKN